MMSTRRNRDRKYENDVIGNWRKNLSVAPCSFGYCKLKSKAIRLYDKARIITNENPKSSMTL